MTELYNNIIKEAYSVASDYDVATPRDSVVLYSISYQPTDENKKKALTYVKEHKNAYMLEDTACGKKLIEMGLETNYHTPQEELMKIWAIASKRFILSASGNVQAFVEGADKRSTFISVELPLILDNKNILTINHIDKEQFAYIQLRNG